jgi:adenosylhomocysteine nucleosidase
MLRAMNPSAETPEPTDATTPNGGGTLAFICAMPMEVRPIVKRLALERDTSAPVYCLGALGGRAVVAVVTGMGTAFATTRTEQLLDAFTVDRVVVVGITGAVENDTPIGTLVHPEVVVMGETGAEYRPTPLGLGTPAGIMWTTDVITPAAEATQLHAKGIVSLDMETAAIAAVCEARGIPWSVVRAISDRATDGSVDPEVFKLSNQDGTPNGKAIAKYFLRHPGRMRRMAKLAKGSQTAIENAADAAIRAVTPAE